MLSLSRVYRIALILLLSLGYLSAHAVVVYADDEEEGGGGDDDDGGGDDGGKGDDGGGGDDDGGGGDDQPDEDQPPVTAGGLYTMRTYPQRETVRPLTMTEKIGQLRLGLGTDLSAKGAFKSFGVSLEGIYGAKDNFSLIGGFTSAYNMKQFGLYFGFEGAIAYDLIDIRVAANVHRTAIPRYCGEFEQTPECSDPTSGAFQPLLPNGKFVSGGTKFSVDLGFPFRYAIKPEIAIVALQTLMSIDFNGIDDGYAIIKEDATNSNTFKKTNVPNRATPDLVPSVGIATNPIPPLSLVVYAQLRVIDFDTSAGSFQVPVTGRVEFSPNQKFDIGLEFTLLNVKPPEGQGPIDNRYLSLFAQARFGK
jgi:hypothetical protein